MLSKRRIRASGIFNGLVPCASVKVLEHKKSLIRVSTAQHYMSSKHTFQHTERNPCSHGLSSLLLWTAALNADRSDALAKVASHRVLITSFSHWLCTRGLELTLHLEGISSWYAGDIISIIRCCVRYLVALSLAAAGRQATSNGPVPCRSHPRNTAAQIDDRQPVHTLLVCHL